MCLLFLKPFIANFMWVIWIFSYLGSQKLKIQPCAGHKWVGLNNAHIKMNLKPQTRLFVLLSLSKWKKKTQDAKSGCKNIQAGDPELCALRLPAFLYFWTVFFSGTPTVVISGHGSFITPLNAKFPRQIWDVDKTFGNKCIWLEVPMGER